jgi:hypothetical protein
VSSAEDDSPWRRPAHPVERPGTPSPAPPAPQYTGPPPTNPPPAGWRPPLVAQPAPPRPLPAQDHDRLDVAEQAARTLTYGVAMVAGAIMLVLLFVLCARGLF